MKGKRSLSRRDFVKITAAGGAGLAASGFLFNIGTAHAADFPKIGDINPLIPNTRAVGLHDPKMTSGEVVKDWAGQNKVTNTDLVGQNFDRMACNLAAEKNTENAWRKIFMKPDGKEWKDVVVAIKTNNIGKQHTRNAVMLKVCNVLVNGFGIAATNVHIYDGCHGGNLSKKTPFKDLPEGTVNENNWGGITTEIDVPDPFGGRAKCVKAFTTDEVDILINIAMCKGHSGTFGGFTMTMKNHFGTFDPGHGHGDKKREFILGINKSKAILGTVDEKTGKVIKPRQQLCIIDALWSSQPGPGGPPTHCTNRLFMGTFSPILDYLVATNFRRDTMKWDVTQKNLDRFLTDFGYAKNDLPNGGKLLNVENIG